MVNYIINKGYTGGGRIGLPMRPPTFPDPYQ